MANHRKGQQPEAQSPAGDVEQPLFTVESAMASGEGDAGALEILESDKDGCTIRLSFGEPRISKSGNSYLVAYDTAKIGALKIAVTAYIPLGKDKARRDTRAGDPERNDSQRAAGRFYNSGR